MSTPKLIAVSLLVLGASLALYGGVVVFSSLPIDVDGALQAKKRDLSGQRDFLGTRMDGSLVGALDLLSAKREVEEKNQQRSTARGGAMPFLVVGLAMVTAAGVILVLDSRKTTPGGGP